MFYISRVCSLFCENGQCAYDSLGAEVCLCDPGFEATLNRSSCQKSCNLKCVNGECKIDDFFGDEFCQCKAGYKLNGDPVTCELHCSLACEHGKCAYDWLGTEVCTCDSGYHFNKDLLACESDDFGTTEEFDDNLEEPVTHSACALDCTHGQCRIDVFGYHYCECDAGFQYNDSFQVCDREQMTEKEVVDDYVISVDMSTCDLQCINGECANEDDNQYCKCKQGYRIGENPVECELYCSLACENGK